MAKYFGDYRKGTTVRIPVNSNGADGASITIATNGTPKAYVDGGTTEITSGVALVEDHDGITGRHFITVDTSGSGFTVGSDVDVSLDGAVVDGKTINAWVGKFSIMRPRYETPVIGLATAGAAGTVTLPASATATDDFYNGSVVSIVSGVGAGQSRLITDYVGSSRLATIDPNWTTASDTTSGLVVTAVPPSSVADLAAMAAANRDDAIQMLVDGIAMSSGDGSGTMTVKDSTGATVTITITRGAANPILSLT